MLYDSPLSRLSEIVWHVQATHLVSVVNEGTPVPRLARIAPERHLFLAFNDISTPLPGMIVPTEAHVAELVSFARRWNHSGPLVIHCFAGISRSTAAAFIVQCAFAPDRDEATLAWDLRAASPSATPNSRLIALADRLFDRKGRMVDAIRAIGRGVDAFEGAPFALPLASS